MSEQVYVKKPAYLKLLKMMYANEIKFNVSKYMIKFWSTNAHAYQISDGPDKTILLVLLEC